VERSASRELTRSGRCGAIMSVLDVRASHDVGIALVMSPKMVEPAEFGAEEFGAGREGA
jgi:hypothetical protein